MGEGKALRKRGVRISVRVVGRRTTKSHPVYRIVNLGGVIDICSLDAKRIFCCGSIR